jgi:putative acetyltransferase
MGVGPDTMRVVTEDQFDEVDGLLCAAFPTDAAARLVRKLREDGDMLHEFQIPWAGKVGGYFALSRMQAPDGWACLAPMAVRPEWQDGKLAELLPSMTVGGHRAELHRPSFRLGSLMLQHLQDLYEIPSETYKRRLPETVIVLGRPSFYARWGFDKARAQKLSSPYPLEYTLILRRGDDIPSETLIYPKAFSD